MNLDFRYAVRSLARARGFTIRFEKSGDLVTSLVVDAGRVRDIRFERAR